MFLEKEKNILGNNTGTPTYAYVCVSESLKIIMFFYLLFFDAFLTLCSMCVIKNVIGIFKLLFVIEMGILLLNNDPFN